eukprot:CAMPEP_0202865778 /NCGR_PEP_ID=MMETSP1391-20130828/6346_1 /ASSEMBLY_ACC=CAM_ASM_000867 /TAXON_ID=1034604 /ORGANISM="Chlamydomonas leiostraca, Strain SAG 11-49" /LENGTH=639 /DNA_ID=CAMNT_0049545655 /DNA_START=304 /DNA_END=2223 /DNA_ORIENTATION=-
MVHASAAADADHLPVPSSMGQQGSVQYLADRKDGVLLLATAGVGMEDSEDDSEEWQPPSSDTDEAQLGFGTRATHSDGSIHGSDEAAGYGEGMSVGDWEQGEDGIVKSEGEDDMEEEEEPPVFCVNCTEEMSDGVCLACGHNMAQDAELFSTDASTITLPAHLRHQHTPAGGKVALVYDERMELHQEGKHNPHPERPDRIRAVMARLLASGLSERCVRTECPPATHEQLASVHTKELIEFVDAMAAGRTPQAQLMMTSDTYINAHTYECARLAAGGAAEVAQLVARGEAAHGAAIIRPPGHHAESNMAMGFCFFNNAAVAAKAAQAAGAQRVLILDWDIHHGNGTQHIFEDDDSVMYMSIHRYDRGAFYPGTGAVDEVGVGRGQGYSVNIPWDGPDMCNGDYISALHHVLLPIAYEFNPDLVIVSAGFDAAEGDPIGGCRVTPECFAHMTAALKAVAPIVLLLEGGYNLLSTATSTEACLRVLLGEQCPHLPGHRHPSPLGLRAIQQALLVQARWWRSLQPAASAVIAAHQAQLRAQREADAAAAAERQRQAMLRPAETPAVAAARTQQRGVPPILAAAARAGGGRSPEERKAARRQAERRAHQVLAAIRKKALRVFWRRHRRVAEQRRARAAQARAAS